MKEIVALVCLTLSLAFGVQNAEAGGGKKGIPTGHEATRDKPKAEPSPPERRCALVQTTEVTTVIYTTPSISAMYIPGPACCCVSLPGTYVQGVNGQYLGTTTALINSKLVCEDGKQ